MTRFKSASTGRRRGLNLLLRVSASYSAPEFIFNYSFSFHIYIYLSSSYPSQPIALYDVDPTSAEETKRRAHAMLAHSKWEANAIAQSKSGASAESGSAREPEDDGFTSGGRDSAIGSQGDLSEAGISSSLFNKMRRGRHVRRRQSGSLDEDAASVRLFVARGMEVLVAQSYSKNLGLYAERIGAMNVISSSPEAAARCGVLNSLLAHI